VLCHWVDVISSFLPPFLTGQKMVGHFSKMVGHFPPVGHFSSHSLCATPLSQRFTTLPLQVNTATRFSQHAKKTNRHVSKDWQPAQARMSVCAAHFCGLSLLISSFKPLFHTPALESYPISGISYSRRVCRQGLHRRPLPLQRLHSAQRHVTITTFLPRRVLH
jgi:hypothetical protein